MTEMASDAEQLRLYTDLDLGVLLSNHAEYLTCSTDQAMSISDNRLRIMAVYENLRTVIPRGSVTAGWQMVGGHEHKSLFEYTFSDEFETYIQSVNALTKEDFRLERHFFTYGVRISLGYLAVHSSKPNQT